MEILVECHAPIANLVATMIRKDMMTAFSTYAPGIPMEINPEVSTHWVH